LGEAEKAGEQLGKKKKGKRDHNSRGPYVFAQEKGEAEGIAAIRTARF